MNAKRALCLILLLSLVVFPLDRYESKPAQAAAPSSPVPPAPAPAQTAELVGAFAVSVTPSPAPEHALVFVRTDFAAKFFDLEVVTVRNNALHFMAPVQTSQPGEWVFVGPPGEYSVRLKAFDPERGIQSAAGNVTIQGEPPAPVPPVVSPTTPEPPPDEPKKKVTRVTYVYEKDHNNVPRPVSLALQQLNAGGSIVAAEFEEDTVDGTGEVPDQFKIALAEARKTGLPSLVVQAGDSVVRVLKSPTTLESVLEAAK
jgi:hypothetical protein